MVDTKVHSEDQFVLLDDISLVNGPCPASLTCNFDSESSGCRWKNLVTQDGELLWSTGSAADNLLNTPP